MSRRALVTILAEDQTQQRFAYWYMRRLGYSLHEIYQEKLPARGGGEHWVRQQYPRIVEAHRAQAAIPRTGIVVLIDADIGPIGRRSEQLSRALAQAGSQPRSPIERIAHLIPKRNIETWVLCLNNKRPNGHPVNENEDYKSHKEARKIGEQIKPAAEIFFNWSRRNARIPQRCVNSLRASIREARRLET